MIKRLLTVLALSVIMVSVPAMASNTVHKLKSNHKHFVYHKPVKHKLPIKKGK